MLNLKDFIFNDLFRERTFILWDETNECVIIDPGCYGPGEEAILSDFIRQNELEVTKILNTHCHFDHILGNHFVKKSYSAPVLAPEKDQYLLELVPKQAPDFSAPNYKHVTPDQWLNDGDVIQFGNSSLEVLHIPGHTKGHVAFFNRKERLLFTGDTLFKNNIGRTDFPGGDYHTIIKSIKEVLLPLGDDVKVIPGHGEDTTIGQEKKYNPALTYLTGAMY